MPTSLKKVGYLDTKIITEDGKILVIKPEPELVKPVIKEVTDEQTLKCIARGFYCINVGKDCCYPYYCKIATGRCT